MIFPNKLIKRFYHYPILLFCGVVFIFWWQDFRQTQQPLIAPIESKENIAIYEPILPIPLMVELNESNS